jgi:hypothetical protein
MPPRSANVATASKSATMAQVRNWLTSEHAIHKAWNPVWLHMERARRGGRYMTDRLLRFDWELPADKKEDGNHAARQRMGVYINFVEMYLGSMWGLLMDKAPTPDNGINYGALGSVRDDAVRNALTNGRKVNPTEAEIFHFNVDGIGNDGSELDSWLMSTGKAAGATGHQFVLVEASVSAPATLADKMRGRRPYLVPYSPTSVWDFHPEDGEYQYFIIRTNQRRPRVNRTTGNMEDGGGTGYYLHVRKGFDGLWDGIEDYSRGGWWRFDHEFNIIKGSDGRDLKGSYEMTDGAIPMAVLYSERDIGTDDLPAMSKPQVMELAALGESYMNLSSAADFETWDSAKGIEYFVGVTTKAFQLATAKMLEGSRYVPIIAAASGQPGDRPTVQSGNTNTTPAANFETRLNRKRQEAVDHGAIQAEDSPDASGRAREASFKKRVAPKLAVQASEIQTFMNTVIPWVEQRNGHAVPRGEYRMTRKFDLLGSALAVRDVFETMALTQATSGTLISEGMGAVLRENGVISDDDVIKTVMAELKKSVDDAAKRENDLANRERDLNNPREGSE